MKKVKLVAFLAILAVSLVYWGCGDPAKPDPEEPKKEDPNTGSNSEINPNGPGAWDPVWSCPNDISAGSLNLAKDNLGIDSHYVIIEFKNGGKPKITAVPSGQGYAEWNNEDGENVKLKVGDYYFNNEEIQYSVIVTGTTANGSLWISGGGRKILYLNGANITNPSGPAINIQSGKRVDVHLVGSCDKRNILKGAGRESVGVGEDKEQFKGAFFSEGSLVFRGSGSLEVSSAKKHAIVSDGFIEVDSGNIIIYQSESDGIHANERIAIKGGTLQIKCAGDAVQNERSDSISISGGKVTLWTTGVKSHGITSDSGDVNVSGGAEIKITVVGDASKGIRSSLKTVKIRGGNTDIETYGNIAKSTTSDPTDSTSSAAGVKGDGFEMSAGSLKIKSAGDNSKGINIERNAEITGGNVRIESVGDGIKVGGKLTVSGGKVTATSTKKKGIDCKDKDIKEGTTTATP